MRYYFEIKTTDGSATGTNSDFTIQFWGEKAQGDTFTLFSAIKKNKVKNGEKLCFSVDSNEDAGCINKIKIVRDYQLLLLDGWAIDYIKVSKHPIPDNQLVSVFQINTKISMPGETKDFRVTSGYPYSVLSTNSRYELEGGGMLYVPPAVSYSKTVTTNLNITVNRSSIKTTDRSTGTMINIPISAINTAFDEHINQSITETLDVSLNTTIDCSDMVNIESTDESITYEILWQKEIVTMSVEMGETIITFEVPKSKTFAGLRQVKNRIQTAVFDSIGIAITRQCTAQCEMCCFECGPDKKEELDKELIFRIIDEAAEIEEIKKIGFTGGEATLRDKVLIEGIERTKLRGMEATLTSNGFWGKEPENARSWMKRLKAAGLDLLTLSLDEYHQKYIPLGSIRNIIRANEDTRIRITLAVGDSLGEQDSAAILRELGEDAYEHPLFLYPFMPLGRGKNLNKVSLKKVNENWSCHNQKMLSVLYNGNVYPCCSQAVYGSLLCEANIKDLSLKEIIDKYQYFSLFSELTHHNFGWLLSKAKEYQIPVNQESHSPCCFCHEIFTNKEFVERIRKDSMMDKISKILLTGKKQQP